MTCVMEVLSRVYLYICDIYDVGHVRVHYQSARAARRYPIVLKRTLALTSAKARMLSTGISLGEWCGL